MEYHTKIRWQKQPENQMRNVTFDNEESKFANSIARRAAYSRVPPNAADINGLACRLEIRKALPGGRERYNWQLKRRKAALEKSLGNKEPSTRVRYVEERKAAAVAVVKAKVDS
ncbi:unnamed protein product [Soboliphyme baturini]|uniref:HYLS1_C domain-containing protein n=1 Tax=Soboliphyme baturini TaxID=241478 RepID=A0A183IZL0_9BILA|nr:unnamed protein product [Soboliphyme baturini]